MIERSTPSQSCSPEDMSVSALLDALAEEEGTTPARILKRVFEERDRVRAMVVNSEGKFTVLRVDVYDREDRVVGRFDLEEEAKKLVRKKTAERLLHPNYRFIRYLLSGQKVEEGVGSSVVYYAYRPDGTYIKIDEDSDNSVF